MSEPTTPRASASGVGAVQPASDMGAVARPRKRARSRRRRLLIGGLALAAISLVVTEVALRAASKVPKRLGVVVLGRFTLPPWRPSPGAVRAWQELIADAKYMVPDPDLGWTLGRSVVPVEADDRYSTNPQGVRAPVDRVYAPQPPAGKVRVVCVGDSFTHGDGVALEDTWEAKLEGLDGRLEVLNMGTPAYGTDQSFLRWRKEGRAFTAHAVILGIWPENLCRNLNLIRFWLSPQSGFSAKPRFVLAPGGELRLVNSPVPQGEELVAAVTDPASWGLIQHERWFEGTVIERHFLDNSRLVRVLRGLVTANDRRGQRRRIYSGEEPEGIAVTTGIARLFASEVQETGAVPVVAIMPMRDLLEEWPEDDDLPLVVELRRAGLTVVNLFPAVRGLEGAFQPDGHLTPRGNEAVAAELARKLPGLVPALAPAR